MWNAFFFNNKLTSWLSETSKKSSCFRNIALLPLQSHCFPIITSLTFSTKGSLKRINFVQKKSFRWIFFKPYKPKTDCPKNLEIEKIVHLSRWWKRFSPKLQFSYLSSDSHKAHLYTECRCPQKTHLLSTIKNRIIPKRKTGF